MKKSLLTGLLLAILPYWAFSQCAATFFDGFESGSYSPTWSIGSGLTSGAVTTTNPASGMYRLEGIGGTSTHLTGFSTAIPAATPTQISWDIYPTGTGASNYMVLGNASVSATNCIAFCYWQGGTNIRFVSSSTAIYTCAPNAWYHIEMRNINWTSHIFDIYINNVLVQANFPFRSATVNDVSRIHLYNFNSATGVWDNVQIGIPNTPNATTVVGNVACFGDTNGTIDLSVTGGMGGYDYLWSNGDTTQDLGALSPGSYSVTVTDIAGCSTTTTVSVTEPPLLTTSGTVTDLTCNGSMDGAIDNTVSGGTSGYTYAWGNGATTQDLSGLMAGNYAVTVTDANGCTALDSFTVTEPSAITFANAITMPTCNGDTNGDATVTPSGGAGGYTYLWNTGSTTASTGAVGAGSYVCIVTDSNGCSNLDSVIVAEPDVLVANATATDGLCAGDDGTLSSAPSGGTASYTYLWGNGDTTATTTAPAGSYTLLVTDANGCTAMDSVTLTEPAAIVASGATLPDTSGTDGSIDLTASGGTGAFTYLWSNGATTEDLSGVAAGTYTVTITDANGCTHVETFTVDLFVGVADRFPIGLQVAPNPFASTFQLRMDGLGSEPVSLRLVDLQGRVLWEKADVQAAVLEIAPQVAAGIYYLQVRLGQQQKAVKVVCQ